MLLSGIAAAPADLGDFIYDQHPGALVPRDVAFRNAGGRVTTIGEAQDGRPAVLALGYFHCPNLCGLVRADLYDALARSGLAPGTYSVIALSIDPAETSADAAEAARADAARFPRAKVAQYFTGDAAAIRSVAEAVGFRNRFDAASKQFLHPAGLVLLTPAGAVSGYLLGLGYKPGELGLGIARAGGGGIAGVASPVLLLCFHFDPTTGRYTLAVLKLLKLAAGLTILVLGCVLYFAFRCERRPVL
jgi:protein SCO1/2